MRFAPVRTILGKHRYCFHNDFEQIKKAFGRLLGSDWPEAFKLGEDYTPQSKGDWYYGEKSVFEIGGGMTL